MSIKNRQANIHPIPTGIAWGAGMGCITAIGYIIIYLCFIIIDSMHSHYGVFGTMTLVMLILISSLFIGMFPATCIGALIGGMVGWKIQHRGFTVPRYDVVHFAYWVSGSIVSIITLMFWMSMPPIDVGVILFAFLIMLPGILCIRLTGSMTGLLFDRVHASRNTVTS